MAETRLQTIRFRFNKANPQGKRRLLKMLRRNGFSKCGFEGVKLQVSSTLKPGEAALHVAALSSFAFDMGARFKQVKANGAKEFAVELY